MKCRLMLVIVIGLFWPVVASAQAAPGAFQELRSAGRLETGDSFFVTRTDGTRVKGRLDEVRPGILRLQVRGKLLEFNENDVTRIERRDPADDGLWVGVLAGSGTIAALAAFCDDPEARSVLAANLTGPLVLGGGLFGYLLDLEKTRLIFDATAARAPRVSLSPVVSRQLRGAAVSIAW